MVEDSIATGSTVYTDEHRAYSKLGERSCDHQAVNHSVKEFVNGMAHINGVESVGRPSNGATTAPTTIGASST